MRARKSGAAVGLAAAMVLCFGALLLKGRAELWWQALAAIATMLILSSAMR